MALNKKLTISLPFYVIQDTYTGNIYYGENHFSHYYMGTPRFIVFVYKKDLGFTVNPKPNYRPLKPMKKPNEYIKELKNIIIKIDNSINTRILSIPIKKLTKYIIHYLIGFSKDEPVIYYNKEKIETVNAVYYITRVLGLNSNSMLNIKTTVWLNLDLSVNEGSNKIEVRIIKNGNNNEHYRILELVLRENELAKTEITGIF